MIFSTFTVGYLQMRKYVVFISLLIWNTIGFAQVPGTWNEYFSFRNVQQLESVDDNVFALSGNGIFIYNTSSQEIQKITKLNGLSTVGLTCMAFCDSTSSFLIGYNDGALDILDYPSLKAKPISTIANKSLYGSKRINAIAMKNDTAVIATEFGVLTFSMRSQKFISTTILSNDGSYVPAKSVTVDRGTLYAATTKGIFSANLSNANISDFSSWTKLKNIPYENDTISHIAALNGTIYYAHKNIADASKDSVFKIHDGKAEAFKTQMDDITALRVRKTDICMSSYYSARLYSQEEKLLYACDTSNCRYKNYTDIVKLGSNDYFVGNKTVGLIYNNTSIMPVGPNSNHITDIQYVNDRLYTVCGNLNLWENAVFGLKLSNNDWYSHDNWQANNSICVTYNSIEDKYYYGTCGNGLVVGTNSWWFDTIYNSKNSIINIQNSESYEVIFDVEADKKGNVWMINFGTSKPLIVKTKENKWYSYSLSTNKNLYKKIFIDKRGYKWIGGGEKLIVFYDNATIDDASDDLLVQIPLQDNEGTIAAHTTCITEDLDGEIWIGTNQGIAVHSAPSRVFKDRQTISRIKIEIDGEVGYLLSSENITCIAVDGGNRKWIGTENSGVFLISENGTEQLLNFTKTNSPLPTNTITSISINHKTGEVFIGTGEGLVSYYGDATIGDVEMNNVKIFPNPIRESYEGDIFIQGIVADAIIKITDISGNLVRTISANGGTAIWDGRNLYGDRVQTGVYLIYISDETAKITMVKKILFIN